jgi:hypothetical protein
MMRISTYQKINYIYVKLSYNDFKVFEKDIFDVVIKESYKIYPKIKVDNMFTAKTLRHYFTKLKDGRESSYIFMIQAGFTNLDIFKAYADGAIENRHFNVYAISDYIDSVYNKIVRKYKIDNIINNV